MPEGDDYPDISIIDGLYLLLFFIGLPFLSFMIYVFVDGIIHTGDFLEKISSSLCGLFFVILLAILALGSLRNKLVFFDDHIYVHSSLVKHMPTSYFPYTHVKSIDLNGRKLTIKTDSWWWLGNWYFYIRSDIKTVREGIKRYEEYISSKNAQTKETLQLKPKTP